MNKSKAIRNSYTKGNIRSNAHVMIHTIFLIDWLCRSNLFSTISFVLTLSGQKLTIFPITEKDCFCFFL